MRIGQQTNAVVTGAANGIGRGIARALARAGARVLLADLEAETLEHARMEVDAIRPGALSAVVDVTRPEDLVAAAAQAASAFGPVHLLINNAGVSVGRHTVAGLDPQAWDWILAVNLGGVLNGLRACLPAMLHHGEPGHVVNTASIGGLQVNPVLRNGSYATTKFAVVALTESLRLELEGTALGASVFCPALVRTTLDQSGRRRPGQFGGPRDQEPVYANADPATLMPDISPDEAGERVIHGVHEDELFIVTHAETQPWLQRRHDRLMSAYDSLARFKAGRTRTAAG